MANAASIQRVEGLFGNPDFCEQFQHVHTQDEMLRVFNENGADLTAEELEEMKAQGMQLLRENGHVDENGEMSPELLDLVSGGGLGKALLCWGAAAVCIYLGAAGPAVIFIIVGLACL